MNTRTLTKSQKDAVCHYKGPLIIIAGPGAGKTWVLIQRVAYLIKEHGVNPGNILLTTFTNKAADELKARLSSEVDEDASKVHISTIHSFCKSILKSYPEYHDLGSGFDVLDDDSQLMFLRNNLDEFGFREDRLMDLMNFYNKCGENEIDPGILIEKIKEAYPNNKTYLKACLSYRKYLELLNKHQKIDFCGLQIAVRNILENSESILKELRNKYKFLLIDEYQDTSPIQDRIFELISQPENNICVVGDDDQSIYSFRGANIQNFVRFPEKYPNANEVRLNKNFRSTQNIIKASEMFMGKHRLIKKEIKPWRSKGNDMVLLKNSTNTEEAQQIVKLIHDMKEHGIIPHYGYITLLFRSVKNHAGAVVRELKKEKIHFTIRGDKSFLKRDDIQAMLYLMHYVDDKEYGKKFKTRWGRWWDTNLLTHEFMNISLETVKKLKAVEYDTDISSLSKCDDFNNVGIINQDDIEKLVALNKFKKELKNKEIDVLSIFYKILDISTYFRRLTLGNHPNRELTKKQSIIKEKNEDILFNLSKLSGIIKRYQEITKNPSLEDFLKFLFNLPKKLQYDEEMLEDPRSVKIMTVHQAKGLEFPVVFICGVSNKKFPLKNNHRDPLPIPTDLLKFVPDGQINEERRLFYVAMTRAQDNLIISPGGEKSEFIDDIEEFSNVDTIIEKCEEREVVKTPLQVSFSSISTYETCPFRYKLIYYYLFEYQPTLKQKYGTILHHCLNRIHQSMQKGEVIDREKVQGMVDKSWAPLDGDDDEDQFYKAQLVDKLVYYHSDMEDYIKEVISSEEPFALFKEDILITGRTDLIIRNPHGEIELVDFKARGESALERLQVGLQLKIYEYGLHKKYKFGQMCAYHFDNNNRSYYPPEKDFKAIEEHIQDICAGIKREDFPATVSTRCANCFFSFCCEDMLP
jgi:DNA helicase-2/ATP-dependent DNA helicase PcrA